MKHSTYIFLTYIFQLFKCNILYKSNKRDLITTSSNNAVFFYNEIFFAVPNISMLQTDVLFLEFVTIAKSPLVFPYYSQINISDKIYLLLIVEI